VEQNRFRLGGRVIHNDGLRHTPAGIPSVQLRLVHVSEQLEAGRSRRVECEVEAVAFGTTAQSLARLAADARINLAGFLDRKGLRDPRPVLHVTEFELIKE
jgi:primosomal replication protein N